MQPRWIGFLIFVWVIAAIIGSVPVGEVLVLNETAVSPVQGVLNFTEVWTEQDWGTLVTPSFHLDFFKNVFALLLLDLPLFGEPNSPWQIVRWIVLAPIIGTVLFGLVTLAMSIFRRNV